MLRANQAYPTEPEIDNFAVRQKDAILALINAGKIREAKAAMDIVIPLWEAIGYSYKIREVNERIATAFNFTDRWTLEETMIREG